MLQSKISKLSKLLTNLQFFLTVIILLKQVDSLFGSNQVKVKKLYGRLSG